MEYPSNPYEGELKIRLKISSSELRSLSQKGKYSHTPWLIISAGKRWCLSWLVDGVCMGRVWHTKRALDKLLNALTMPNRLVTGGVRSQAPQAKHVTWRGRLSDARQCRGVSLELGSGASVKI